MANRRVYRLFFVITLLCVACGGGGGSPAAPTSVYVAPPPPTYPDLRGSWAGARINTIIWSTGDSYVYNYTVLWVINQASIQSNQLSGTVQREYSVTGSVSTNTFTGTVSTTGNISISFDNWGTTCQVQSGSRTYAGSLVSGTLSLSNSRVDLCTLSSGLLATATGTRTVVMQRIGS